MQHFYQRRRPAWLAIIALLVMLFGTVTAASAQSKEITDVELNKEYDYPMFKEYYFRLTAPKSGRLVVTSKANAPYPYTDDTYTTPLPSTEYTTNNTGSEVYMTVEEGKVYYFYGESWISNNTVVFKMQESTAVTMTNVSPAENSTLDVTGTGLITLTFSETIKNIAQATITSGINTVQIPANANATKLSCDFKDALYQWLKKGTVKEGDEITLTVKNITSALDGNIKYGEDGTLTLKFKAPKAPGYLVKSTVPAVFQQEWKQGDADGIATFTFSDNLLTTGIKATLRIGNIETGQLYQETSDSEDEATKLPMTIKDNTITVDLTGKKRDLSELIPGADLTSDNFKSYTLRLSNIKTADGKVIYTESQGSVGSITYSIPIDNTVTPDVTVTSDITPANGTDLKAWMAQGGKNVEIYVSPVSKITYTGMKFSYDNADNSRSTVVIPNDKLTVETEETEDAALISYALPDSIAEKSNVYVTLDGLTFADHASGNIGAMYNVKTSSEFKVTLLEPTTTTLKQLTVGDIIKVTTSRTNDIGYLEYEIWDKGTNECAKAITWLTKNLTDNTFSSEILGSDIKLYANHKYRMTFYAWPSEDAKRKNQDQIGTYEIELTGLTPEFKFSPVKLVSITPDPETTVIESTDQNKVTLTFDGRVNLDPSNTVISLGTSGQESFEALTPMDADKTTVDGKSYSKVWELTIRPSFLAKQTTGVDLVIWPTDENGLQVEGNTGTRETSYFHYSYTVTTGRPSPDFTPVAGATVYGSLKTINAEYASAKSAEHMEGAGIAQYSGKVENAVVTNAAGEEVAHVASAIPVIPDGSSQDYDPTRIMLTLDKELTEPGEYTVTFPQDYFIYGSGMFAFPSKKEVVKYTVAAIPATVGQDLAPVTVDPADGSQVDSLKSIKLTFDKDVDVVYAKKYAVEIVNNETNAVTGGYLAQNLADRDTKSIIIVPNNTISAIGKYTVNVPAGAIGDADYTADKTTGHVNGALSYTISVGGALPEVKDTVTTDPADGSYVKALQSITLIWKDKNTWIAPNPDATDKIKLYNENGDVVATEYAVRLIDAYYVAIVEFEKAITTEGTYKLVVPAGRFTTDEQGTVLSSAQTFIYHVGEEPAKDNVTTDPADGSTVEKLNSFIFTWVDEDNADDNANCTETIKLYNENNEVVAEAGSNNIEYGEGFNQMKVTLNKEITADGKYTLKVPASRFLLNDAAKESSALTFTYIVKSASGINGVEADASGRYNVYNVAGVRVMSTADKASLKSLKAGLYIVNGKKIAVK